MRLAGPPDAFDRISERTKDGSGFGPSPAARLGKILGDRAQRF